MKETVYISPPVLHRIIREHIERKNPGVSVVTVNTDITTKVRGSLISGLRADAEFNGLEVHVENPKLD